MPLDLVETLRRLVAIPSVNPMGQAVNGAPYLEKRLTDHLESVFQQLGLTTARTCVEEGRDNLLVRLDGETPPERGGSLLLWDAHQDTVPADGMTIEPWNPEIKDGRLYGRGSCDVKGGMAAMIAALARLADERPPSRPTIVMACTVNEENGFTGATAVTQFWCDPSAANGILPRRPDACIVSEPTELDVVVAHKGVVRWRCHTVGRATHSSQPERGSNAIYKMVHVVAALERYAQQVVPQLSQHPRCGKPTLSVGTIKGGLSVNTVPERCTVEIDRRLIPGELPEQAWQHAVDALACEPHLEAIHDPPFLASPGLTDEHNGPLAARLEAIARAAGADSRQIAVHFGTNAAAYARAGVPTVVFGPGCIAQAHTADEWIAVAQLELASEILYRLGRKGLAGS